MVISLQPRIMAWSASNVYDQRLYRLHMNKQSDHRAEKRRTELRKSDTKPAVILAIPAWTSNLGSFHIGLQQRSSHLDIRRDTVYPLLSGDHSVSKQRPDQIRRSILLLCGHPCSRIRPNDISR